MSAVPAKYDAMCRAIDAAYEVDEVKGIHDQAVALEVYARQAKNTEAERRACEIRLRAERKAGQLSAKIDRSKGGRPSKTRAPAARVSKTEQLRAAGVTPRQAKDWEKLGAVPDRQFEVALADPIKTPTTKGIISGAKPPKQNPVSTDALWLWGRLRDFNEKMLAKDPADVMATLTDQMKNDVHTLAPRVAAWLRRIGAIPPTLIGALREFVEATDIDLGAALRGADKEEVEAILADIAIARAWLDDLEERIAAKQNKEGGAS